MNQPRDRHTEQLLEQLVAAITDGAERIALWGVSSALLRLLVELGRAGLGEFVVGLVDHRGCHQGRKLGTHRVLPPAELGILHADTIVITLDRDKDMALRALTQVACDHPPRVLFSGNSHYDFRDPLYEELTCQPLVRSHAGGYPHMQIHLYQALVYIARRGLRGHVAEFGVYKGGTLMFLARTLDRLGHPARVYGFDTFAGFPQPRSILDLHADPDDEFPDPEAVRAWTGTNPRIELVEGDIMRTYTLLVDIPLVLSFFDTDNYSATRAALPLCYQQTVPGGVLAFDHLHSPDWPSTIGERLAALEVLNDKPILHLHGTGIVLKW